MDRRPSNVEELPQVGLLPYLSWLPRQPSVIFPNGASHGRLRIWHQVPPYAEVSSAVVHLVKDDMSIDASNHSGSGPLLMALRNHGGHVLIAGMGLGLIPLHATLRDNVTKVTVIESDPDVIALVTPYLRAEIEAQGKNPGKLEVIEADILSWKPPKGQKYDVIWFDIWSRADIRDEVRGKEKGILSQMTALNRRFARRTRHWRGSRGESQLRMEQNRRKYLQHRSEV